MKRGSMTAASFLERAAELRSIAGQINDAHSRSLLIGAAEEYERMADKRMSRAESAGTPK